jgi:hypothetical protein
MRSKNKLRVTFTIGEFKVKTFIPKSRKLRKRLVGTGNCSIDRCASVLRNRYKGLFHAYLYSVPATTLRAS